MSSPPRQTGLIAQALVGQGRAVRYRRGQALFAEGDRGERVFLLEKGWVVLSCIGSGGREIVLGMSGPGDVAGELSAFDGHPRSATAIAADDVRAVVAPASVLLGALEDMSTAHELIAVLAGRLRDADRGLIEFATLPTLGRLSLRLLELSERFGHETPAGIEVALPLSQELASWCGASREATVIALDLLRSLKIITTGRRRFLIHDPDGLIRHTRAVG